MLKHLTAYAAIIFATTGFAQEVISTQGDSYSNASGSIDFTIGEVVISTVSDANNTLTQGFHQTHWNFVGLDDHVPEFEASVFPNPTEDMLNIRSAAFENISYALYDARGRKVLEGILTQDLTNIQVSHLLPGSYELTLTNAETIRLKTFKLVKHQ